MSKEPALLTLTEAAQAIAKKRFSSREVTQSCLDRIAQWQPRINAFMAIEAEAALRRALNADPANYDANRELGSLLLSQHRFREAVRAGEKNRDARPYDAINYGIIGDGHLELGEY